MKGFGFYLPKRMFAHSEQTSAWFFVFLKFLSSSNYRI